MQLNNIVLKSVVAIIFLLNIGSFVSTQEAWDDLVEAFDDIRLLGNLTEDDIGESRNSSITTVNLTNSSIPDSNETTEESVVTDSAERNSTDSGEITSEESPVTDELVSNSTSEGTTLPINATVSSTEMSNSSSTDVMITESTSQRSSTERISSLPSGGSSSSTTSKITTTAYSGGSDNTEEAKVRPWAIATITIFISFAIVFTVLYFLRGYLIKKRRMDQRRLLGSRVSQEGFFFGESGDGFREL